MIPLSNLWMIDDAAMRQMQMVAPVSRFATRIGIDASGDADVQRVPHMAGPDLPARPRGVAIVPVTGVLTKRMSMLGMLFGGTAMADTTAAVAALAADESVGTIVLYIDSPGGTVDGTEELADAVAGAAQSKRVIAQIDGMAASGAYYIASQATEIRSNPTALVGNIGVRVLLYDYSKAFDNEGVEAVVVDTGAFKSTGATGSAITDEQREDVQRIVDGQMEFFRSRVMDGRGMSDAEFDAVGDGRVFRASNDAVALGLVDRIATTAQTLDELRAEQRSADGNAALRTSAAARLAAIRG